MGGDTATRMAQEASQRASGVCGSLGPAKPDRSVLRGFTTKELKEEIVVREVVDGGWHHELGLFRLFAAQHFRMTIGTFTSRCRKARIARPRLAAMSAARELGMGSLQEVGAAFGKRDHGTVIYACERTDNDDELGEMREVLIIAWQASKAQLAQQVKERL